MRVSVKGYLAMLVGVFVVGLLAVSLVNRNLAGSLGGTPTSRIATTPRPVRPRSW